MKIETDSTPMEAPKKTEGCNVFELFKILASEEQISNLKKQYEGGNFGYGHAKQALFELILEKFAKERKAFDYFINKPKDVEEILENGALKAKAVAEKTIHRVKEALGY